MCNYYSYVAIMMHTHSLATYTKSCSGLANQLQASSLKLPLIILSRFFSSSLLFNFVGMFASSIIPKFCLYMVYYAQQFAARE